MVLPARGLTDQNMGLHQRVQPQFGKESVGPALMVSRPATPPSAVTLTQNASQAHSYPSVHRAERGFQAVLEITKPAPQRAIDVGDDARQARAIGPLGLGPQVDL